MIQIREYTEKDREEILSLMQEFCEYVEGIDPLKLVQYKEKSAEFYTELMLKKNSENGKIYTATDGDSVVGFIGGHVSMQDEDEQMELVQMIPGHITDFFVTKSYRGQKIGQTLMNKIESFFKENNVTIVRLEVFAPNEIARAFYNKYGFIERLITVSKLV